MRDKEGEKILFEKRVTLNFVKVLTAKYGGKLEHLVKPPKRLKRPLTVMVLQKKKN